MSSLFDFSVFPVLTTERLVLRRLRHDDAPAINALFSHPQVLEYLDEEPLETDDRAIAMIDWMQSMYEKQVAVRWGITLKGQDRVIGTVGFHYWQKKDRHADLGYDLHPDYWGKGYATEAARAVVDWCFVNLNLHRMQADCTLGNDRSERTILKLGFQPEGVWREKIWEHGRFVDIKQFGLLRREWEAGRVAGD